MSELRRYDVRGTDGRAGTVSDILFDDASWRARYVVADTGSWFRRHDVLIAPPTLDHIQPAEHAVRISLNEDQIGHCRPVDADLPVAVRMERQLHNVVFLAGCWLAGFGEPYPAQPAMLLTSDSLSLLRTAGGGDRHLRSAAHLVGIQVRARDGQAGSVEDFVIDDDGWTARDIVVRTHGWPHRKSVLVSPL